MAESPAKKRKIAAADSVAAAANIYDLSSIIETYNKIIKNKEQDLTFCDGSIVPLVETCLKQPISKRLRRPLIVDGERDAEQYKKMCGCRLTAKLMFIIIKYKLNPLNQDDNKQILELYNKIFLDNRTFTEKQKLVYDILGPGIKDTVMKDILKNIKDVDGISPVLKNDNTLYIVQILQKHWGTWGPVHTFIVKNVGPNNFQIISSWFAGGEKDQATPILQETFTFQELKYGLQPDNLKINSEYLFGKGNKLSSINELAIVFISQEAISPSSSGGASALPGGGKRRKRRTRKGKRKGKRKGRRTRKNNIK